MSFAPSVNMSFNPLMLTLYSLLLDATHLQVPNHRLDNRPAILVLTSFQILKRLGSLVERVVMARHLADVTELTGSQESEGVGVGVAVSEDTDEVDFGEERGAAGKSEDFGAHTDEKDLGTDSSGLEKKSHLLARVYLPWIKNRRENSP